MRLAAKWVEDVLQGKRRGQSQGDNVDSVEATCHDAKSFRVSYSSNFTHVSLKMGLERMEESSAAPVRSGGLCLKA